MIKDIEINEKIVKIEYIIPDELKKFLEKNNINENQLLKNYKWEQCIYEDLLDENHKILNEFKKAKLVINYIHINQENNISLPPEKFVKGKFICKGNWNKGSFFEHFSIGYSIFSE